MSSHIPESDWRCFKEVRALLLERFCAQTLGELAAVARATEGTAHQRYLHVWKLVQRRDEELARAFNDFRRSTAVMQLGIMPRMGLLTDEDLKLFSEATQTQILGIASI